MMFLDQAKARHGRRMRLPVALGLCGLVGAVPRTALTEVPPKPVARVSLTSLGFPGYAASLLHQGASMTTVHVLDDTHVLFTYSLRSLVPRLPGDNANDTDRQVAGVLVEVPSGKVLARTVWHLHDHGRYLWHVGEGIFVLRMGSELSVLAPLRMMAAGHDAFLRYALPHRPGQPVLVEGSPDGKIVTVELALEEPRAAGDDDSEPHRHRRYALEFYRLLRGESAATVPLSIERAGAIASPGLVRLAMDGDGYLWAEDGDRGRWTLSFNEFGGKQEKLAPIMSSCHPRLSLLSRSQFLVETCRGTEQAPMLASFGFDGHENWQESFGESLQPPTLALAPAAGRFAMSRLVASSGGAPVSGMADPDPISQEIRVYQTESGDMLLHVQCAPAVRSSENFDLSPDGRTLGVLSPNTLDLYRLSDLSAKDRKDLAEAQTMTPPVGFGPVALTRITRPIAAQESVAGGDAVRKADEPAVADTTVSTIGASAGVAAASVEHPAQEPKGVTKGTGQRGTEQKGDGGRVPAEPADASDVAPEASRKPPTLLNPGEHPEFKGQPGTPQ